MFWILLAAAAAAADLGIKRWIRHHKDLNSSQPILGGRIIITKYFNPGAMLGFMKDQAKLLSGITLVALGLIAGLLLAFTGRKGYGLVKLGLSLLLGGALSNAWERLTYKKVTDYFRISIGCRRLERVVFNIGDFCIFVGTVLAFIGSMCKKPHG